jgi:2-dehydropantoate 2-reductase
MRLLVVGAGSTGGYFGGRLAQAGRDVTFLVRPTRAAQLRDVGLRIISPHGNMELHPQLVTADAIAQPYDAVLLTVKGFQLDTAISDFAPAIGPETMILPVLNGMRHMEILAERFTPHNLVGCALKVATTLDDDGRIVQLSPLQDLAYGELDGGMTSRIQGLNAFLQNAGFDARLSPTIRREMWEKWVLLASLGAITCLMRGTIGEVEAAPGGTAFASSLLDDKGSPFASSMYRDLQQGRPIEIEEIIGDLLRRGQKSGLETPLLEAAYTHLSVYQNRIAKTS